jgi:hypothetical protein
MTATTITASDRPGVQAGTEVKMSLRWAKTAGFAYAGAWMLGLAAFGTGPATNASNWEIASYYAGHRLLSAVQASFTHGAAAVALLTVLIATKRMGATSRTCYIAGLTAVGLSLAQYVLDLVRSLWSTGSATTALVHAIDRADGLKMFALAAMIYASIAIFRSSGLIGPKMAVTGRITTAALVLSGAGYASAITALAPAAELSLLLLIIWVGYTGVAVARHGQ